MYIQYEGFEVTASSRIYAFHVISSPDAACHVTVTVQSDAFRPNGLQLQDGPGICFARLDKELQGKAQDSRAEAHLLIGESDIKEYLGLHHSLKKPGKKEEI
jgi:hypothetical protein